MTAKRSGTTFTFNWKRGGSYSAQLAYYSVNTPGRKWIGVDVSSSATSWSTDIHLSPYYPFTQKKVSVVQFSVVGVTSAGRSRECKLGFSIFPPCKPTVSFALDENNANAGAFSWTVTKSDTNNYPFYDVQYQTYFGPTQATPVWTAAGTARGSGSVSYTEDAATISSGSHKRAFRIRARGMGGDSGWVEYSHIYSAPGRAKIDTVKAEDVESFYRVSLTCSAADNLDLYPVDSATVQYTMTAPGADMTCPSDASWTDAKTVSELGGFCFDTSTLLAEDQVLFVRVATTHDKDTAYSDAVPVEINGEYGTLKAPTITSITTDKDNNAFSVKATQNSEVVGAFIAIYYAHAGDPLKCVGIAETDTETAFSVTELKDDDEIAVKSVQGEYNAETGAVSEDISSALVSSGGLPSIPDGVIAVMTGSGSVRVSWGWDYSAAVGAEVSWSKNKDAWGSNNAPSTLTVTKLHAPMADILSLDGGSVYYFRVRYILSEDGSSTGEWSEITSASTVNLSDTPTTPALTLSRTVITTGDTVTAAWAYSSGDGTSQAVAEIYTATVTADGITYDNLIATAESEQSVIIDGSKFEEGKSYNLAVRVVSAAGVSSDFSPVVGLSVLPAITATIAETSLEKVTIDEAEVDALTALPLTVTVSGAGVNGSVRLIVERAADYHVERPDGQDFDGYEGETVYTQTVSGLESDSAEFSISADDLIGRLDDGAQYRIVAVATDYAGQTAEASIPFVVAWNHQAIIPSGTVEVDADALAVKITPTADGAGDGDTCDIYRLTGDGAELIYKGAEFDSTYVDPYPALGGNCGHRIVYITAEGDYITADNTPAWHDILAADGDVLDVSDLIIDFAGRRARIPYDLTFDNSWEKDFKRTVYLGGSVVGDWSVDTARNLSITANLILTETDEQIDTMRALAVYPGACHVRTPDGSAFMADVEVQEKREIRKYKCEYSISIKRIDSGETDGMTLDEWEELNG